MKWLDTFKDKLIEDCRQWYKMWSSWLAILWGFLVTTIWNYPEVVRELTDQMPEETRALMSPLVFALAGGLPILVRLMKQQKLIDKLKGVHTQEDEVR